MGESTKAFAHGRQKGRDHHQQGRLPGRHQGACFSSREGLDDPGLSDVESKVVSDFLDWFAKEAKDCINVDNVKCCILVGKRIDLLPLLTQRSQLVAKPTLSANIRCESAGQLLLKGISSIALRHQWMPLRCARKTSAKMRERKVQIQAWE